MNTSLIIGVCILLIITQFVILRFFLMNKPKTINEIFKENRVESIENTNFCNLIKVIQYKHEYRNDEDDRIENVITPEEFDWLIEKNVKLNDILLNHTEVKFIDEYYKYKEKKCREDEKKQEKH